MSNPINYATKLCWGNRCKVRSPFIAILFFVSSVSCLVPFILWAAAKANAAAPINVEVEQGRLTLSVHDAPLGEVLQTIGEKAGIVIEIRGDLNARITESLIEIPLEEGIRQLLRDQSFAIKYKSLVNLQKERRLRAGLPTGLTDDNKKQSFNGSQRRWFLQVNSSPKQSEAVKLVADLTAKGYHAYFVPAHVRGGLWYRVRLGPLSTAAEAQALRDVIVSKERFRDAFVGLDVPMTAEVNKLQEPMPHVALKKWNLTAPQGTTPVEISVLAGPGVGSERRLEKVTTPEEAQKTFQEIQALARRKDIHTIAKLSNLALGDPSPTVRSQAVFALGMLRDQRALAPLTLALADETPSVRIQAMRAIKNLKGPEAIRDLYGVVANDPDPLVRGEALRFLSEMENADVIGLLNSVIADDDVTVSRAAREALKAWEQRFGVRTRATGSIR